MILTTWWLQEREFSLIIGVLCAIPFMLFIFHGCWHGGKLHIEDFGEDFPKEITVLHAHICLLIVQQGDASGGFFPAYTSDGCGAGIAREEQKQSTVLGGYLVLPCFPPPVCHLQFPAPWCPGIKAILNWTGCVLSVFCSGVSNKINFGEAENWSLKQHFNSKPSTHHYPLV